MLFASLLASSVLLGVIFAIARRGNPGSLGAASMAAAVAAVLGFFCLQSLTVSLNAILVCIFGLICLACGGQRRSFIICSLAATLTAYGLLIPLALSEVQEWAVLKQQYPLESLAERLSYEQRQTTQSTSASPDTAENGTPGEDLNALEKQLGVMGAGSSATLRVRSLEHLHTTSVQQFIQSQGFGPMRMVNRPMPLWLTMRASEPVPMPSPSAQDSPSSSTSEDKIIAPESKGPPSALNGAVKQDLKQLHWDGLVDFADPTRFGYVRDVEHVAGFVPHEFSQMPGESHWSIKRLELVSLLKHAEPAVYLSEYLPRMAELREAKLRSLDAFEKQALAHLRNGHDGYAENRDKHIRMLGAIRAVQQCLRCHQVKRGQLLGAFTYDLQRLGAMP